MGAYQSPPIRSSQHALREVEMTDGPCNQQFESIGTILCRVTSDGPDKIFFVPDSDHLLSYSRDSYAVFVKSPPHRDVKSPPHRDNVRDALVVRLRDNNDLGIFIKKSIPIEISSGDDMKNVVLLAAKQQAKVTVKVCRKSESIELSGITFPAG